MIRMLMRHTAINVMKNTVTGCCSVIKEVALCIKRMNMCNALHLAFATRTQVKEYKKLYCRSCWGKCMIANMLKRKWGCEDAK